MFKKKKKGHKVLWVVLLIIVIVIGGFAINYRYNQSKAYVQSVDEMNSTWVLNGNTYSGNISDDATQNIYLTGNE